MADEYYTSDVAYLPASDPVEPWEANATALRDPATLKWKDLVTAGTPLPTPWNKEAFEAHSRDIQVRRRAIRAANKPEADMDALFQEQQAEEVRMLACGALRHGGGRIRGRHVRGPRLLPAAGRLHHVHAQPGAVLCGVPEGVDGGD